jgi:DinB superfamily
MMMVGAVIASGQSQNKPPEKWTISSTLDSRLSAVERASIAAAEAMPADRYEFVPNSGEVRGDIGFGEIVKHVASYNYIFFSAVLGQAPPTFVPLGLDGRGPATLTTKDEILKYLRDSFALGHRAIANITPDNALLTVSLPPKGFSIDTPLALAVQGIWHTAEHSGQLGEYLRDAGILPPGAETTIQHRQASMKPN